MLKTILSISGKPGLYKLVSQGKNMLIVESIVDKNASRLTVTKRLFRWVILPCIRMQKIFH